MCVEVEILTGNRPQYIRDEDLHKCLIQDVITAPHPLFDWLIFTQSDQLLSGESSDVLHILFTAQYTNTRLFRQKSLCFKCIRINRAKLTFDCKIVKIYKQAASYFTNICKKASMFHSESAIPTLPFKIFVLFFLRK